MRGKPIHDHLLRHDEPEGRQIAVVRKVTRPSAPVRREIWKILHPINILSITQTSSRGEKSQPFTPRFASTLPSRKLAEAA